MACALHWLPSGGSDYNCAIHLCSESLALWRKVGRPDRIADLLILLGWYQYCFGDYAQAKANWQEGLELCQQLESRNAQAWALDCIGFAAWGEGEMAVAEQSIQKALAMYTDFGRQTFVGMCQAELALVLASIGQVEQAIRLAQAAVATTRAVNGQVMLTVSLNYLGAVLIIAGDLVTARHTLIEAIQRGWEYQYYYNLMTAFYYFAELLVQESRATNLPGSLDRQALAVTLLSCVRTQTATWQIFKDKAAQLQSEIEGALPGELFSAAVQQGQSYTLQEMVNALLEGEPNMQIDNPKRSL
jgi:tetratricopeptide (TPR) repeat protein